MAMDSSFVIYSQISLGSLIKEGMDLRLSQVWFGLKLFFEIVYVSRCLCFQPYELLGGFPIQVWEVSWIFSKQLKG